MNLQSNKFQQINNNMKKNFKMMAFVCLFTVAALISCSKDDDNNGADSGAISNVLTVVVENGSNHNSMIDVVKLLAFGTNGEDVLAESDYTDGRFTLNLPNPLGSQYLNPVGDIAPYSGITVSNRNVKIGDAALCAFKENEETGYFYTASGNWEGELVYVDGDVSITGTYSDTEEEDGVTYTETIRYNMNLKKGWNIFYSKSTEDGNTETTEITTTVPAGVKWYFYSYGSYSGSSFRSRMHVLSDK
jgi:hypothetical protein